MARTLLAAKYVSLLLVFTLVAVPVFAANSEMSFHALSGIAADEQPTVSLTDTELAEVEGQGPFLDALVATILLGQDFISLGRTSLGQFFQLAAAAWVITCTPGCN